MVITLGIASVVVLFDHRTSLEPVIQTGVFIAVGAGWGGDKTVGGRVGFYSVPVPDATPRRNRCGKIQ